jgi:4-hydroxymandelate oxidase
MQVAKAGADLAKALSLPDFAELARDRIFAGGLGARGRRCRGRDHVAWNREAYYQIRLRLHVLVDVSKLDTRVTLFGQELAFPIFLSPTGGQGVLHEDGDLGVARSGSSFMCSAIANSRAIWCRGPKGPDAA